ncbi:MAG: DUF4493 domain-containing protein [Muribaculaceae bacterium]|nr:DUF4493 domain-containing protein [Muribaculaceae bacterium]
MYKFLYIILGIILFGCTNEQLDEGIDTSLPEGFGGISMKTLSVNVEERTIESRAGDDLSNGKVTFINEDGSEEITKKLSEVQGKVIPLPAKSTPYHFIISIGENPEADWDSPYAQGKSENFIVENKRVTEITQKISCSPSNILITVEFDDDLYKIINRSETSVIIGHEGGSSFLTFGLNDIITPGYTPERKAYYKYIEGKNYLIATLITEIEGNTVTLVSKIEDLKAGHSRNIKYYLKSISRKADYTQAITVTQSDL